MKLPDRLIDKYRTLLEGRERGQADYEICPLCGFPQLVCSRPEATERTPRLLSSGNICYGCHELEARYPELVRWVARVIGFQHELLDHSVRD